MSLQPFPPPPPPAPVKSKRGKYIGIGVVVVVLIALYAIGHNAEKAASMATPTTVAYHPTVTTATSEYTDEDINIMALDAVWKNGEMCDAVNQAVEDGLSRSAVIDYGVGVFFKSASSIDRTPALEAHLRDLLEAC